MKSQSIVIVLALAAVLVTGGCQYIRKVTYPPEFVYLETDQIRGSMRDLAVSVDSLDRTLADAVLSDDERNRRVQAELAAMDRISAGLGAGPSPTNHLLIDRHIDRFRADLAAARDAAAANPPRYHLAGRIIGSCTACHVLR